MESVEFFSQKLLELLDKIWHLVIVSVGNKDIKVSNLVTALFVLHLALRHHRQLAQFAFEKIIPKEYRSNKAIIERSVSLLLGVILTVLVLQISNIPVDSFAFLGGALALGVGLGVQTLINNLISSLIIAIEKPIEVGDTVTINNTTGKIKSISSRCVTIETPFKGTLFIPSSAILQTNLINWTKGRSVLLGKMILKVPKGHDKDHMPDQVQKIIEKAFDDENANGVTNAKVSLQSIESWQYVYLVSYEYKQSTKTDVLKHNLHKYLLDNLGSQIVTEFPEAK